MSWISKLCETYERNTASIGNPHDKIPLLPICHTTQMAHIQITLNARGDFLRAAVVPPAEARTIIPCTEDSGGRTSGPTPHPLCDKLQYIAQDYLDFGGGKTPCYNEYMKLLSSWLASTKGNTKLSAIYSYSSKGRVISDLVHAGILHVEKVDGDDTHPKLMTKWTKEGQSPEIFSVLNGTQSWQADAFIRWIVEIPGELQANVWNDPSLWESWIEYYTSIQPNKDVCYMTGQITQLAEFNPAKIRRDGDKAKLISANDKDGFTFRGRFRTSQEAFGIGLAVTHKAHNALRWLIARQGTLSGDQTVVAWAVSGKKIPDPLADTWSLLSSSEPDFPSAQTGYTAQDFGLRLSKMIHGYSVELGETEEIIVMALDSASKGRMAIRFYRELSGSEFLDRLLSWHLECCWPQRMSKDLVFTGAPAPKDIVTAAYGSMVKTELRNATLERLLPCIIDGNKIPRDLVQSCVRRACNRPHFEKKEWEKTLGIACSLFKKYHIERRYEMALERDRTTRDYLYGRLLALAEHLEARALYLAGEKRESNAAKMMPRFADRPHSTWRTLELSLTPYKTRLRAKSPGFLYILEKEMDEIIATFTIDDFTSERPLTGEFLLGYHCQRSALITEKPSNKENTEEMPEE